MPDYMFLLESRLLAEQHAAVLRMQELAGMVSANLYLVGGAVRDLISGMPIRDLDFVVEGNPSRMVRELEKGGARVVLEDERLRYVELVFAGEVEGSISAARDEVYERPGARPEMRWSTIMEDLRRRDFSLNAIALSLNPASRGLLLDPCNGLGDLEKHEVRALSIHSFTNQPVRLLRALRYRVRLGFKMETRTGEWFALALERGLQENIPPPDVGQEMRQLAREDKPSAILKSWEAHGLIGAIHPQLARRHPHYDALQRLMRVRDEIASLGHRPRLFAPVTRAVLARLKPRERSAALTRMELPAAERAAVLELEEEAKRVVKVLASRKTAMPRDAFTFLEGVPLGVLAFIQAEMSHAKALSKIRHYLHKWRPLRRALPLVATELETLGMPRGPKFDKVLEDFFQLQLQGKGRKPEERVKLLRKLSGIKEPPKKPAKEEKKRAASKAAAARLKRSAAARKLASEEAAAGLSKPLEKIGTAPAAAPQRVPLPGKPHAGPLKQKAEAKGEKPPPAPTPEARPKPGVGAAASGKTRKSPGSQGHHAHAKKRAKRR